MRYSLGQAATPGLALRVLQSGEAFARAMGLRIPQDSLYNTLQRLLTAEQAVEQTRSYLEQLGRFNAVTTADVARYDSARTNLFAAELRLFVELNTNRPLMVAWSAANLPPLAVPLMALPYSGFQRQSTMREELRLGGSNGVRGLGAAPAAAAAASPVFWAAIALAGLALIAAAVVAAIFLTSDTAGAVMGSVVMALSARTASYQRLLGVVACNARHPMDAAARNQCIDQVISAVPIQEDYRLLLETAGGAATWFLWLLGGVALTFGGYALYQYYLKPKGYFRGISGPRRSISVGSSPNARALPRATLNRRDRYSHGGSLRVSGGR